ncbi:hypothetical protein DPMN_187303 [Dreissena polymorpha]|uniref:Uncharacterized protein n=1 Tax=Dreissena polymorpha TaxID=45954 RepID=A0A9D4I8Y1_DREPO|nr:hypothetical protein DPMN_187303 [Dreissena polymorpha]
MVNTRSCSDVDANMPNYWTPSGTNITKTLSRGNFYIRIHPTFYFWNGMPLLPSSTRSFPTPDDTNARVLPESHSNQTSQGQCSI